MSIESLNMVTKGLVVICAGIVGAAVMTGCTEKSKEPFRDAPQGGRNSDPAIVVEMPDGFSNFAHKCIAPGIRGASAYKGDQNRAAVSMVADSSCK